MVSKHELTGNLHRLNVLCYKREKNANIAGMSDKRQSLSLFSVMTVLTGVSDVIFLHHCAMFFIVLSCIVVSPLFTSEVMTHQVSSNMVSFDAYIIFIEAESFCGYC